MTSVTSSVAGRLAARRDARPRCCWACLALTFAAAVPVRGRDAQHAGRASGRQPGGGHAADGVNYDWWQEFVSQASGLGATFTPRIVGFAATLDSLSAIARRAASKRRPCWACWPATWRCGRGSGRHHRSLRPAAANPRARLRRGQRRVLLPIPAARRDRRRRLLVAVRLPAPVAVRRALRGPDARARQRTGGVRVAPGGVRGVRRCWSWPANVVFDYAKIRMVVEDRRSAAGGLVGRRRASSCGGPAPWRGLCVRQRVGVRGAGGGVGACWHLAWCQRAR